VKEPGRPVRNVESKPKQSFYFPDEMLAQIRAEARRLDRSLSWVVQRAWRLARETIRHKAGAPSPSATTGDNG
jgi:uncharacterized small protein (TIGR04563 family)